MLFWMFARTTFGLIMLFFAPAISTRFYKTPSEITHDKNAPNVSEQSILRVGIQLFAIYALLLAIQPLGNLGVGYASGVQLQESYLQNLLSSGVYLGFALLLIMWNENVVTFLEKIRYSPERDAYAPPPVGDLSPSENESNCNG